MATRSAHLEPQTASAAVNDGQPQVAPTMQPPLEVSPDFWYAVRHHLMRTFDRASQLDAAIAAVGRSVMHANPATASMTQGQNRIWNDFTAQIANLDRMSESVVGSVQSLNDMVHHAFHGVFDYVPPPPPVPPMTMWPTYQMQQPPQPYHAPGCIHAQFPPPGIMFCNPGHFYGLDPTLPSAMPAAIPDDGEYSDDGGAWSAEDDVAEADSGPSDPDDAENVDNGEDMNGQHVGPVFGF